MKLSEEKIREYTGLKKLISEKTVSIEESSTLSRNLQKRIQAIQIQKYNEAEDNSAEDNPRKLKKYYIAEPIVVLVVFLLMLLFIGKIGIFEQPNSLDTKLGSSEKAYGAPSNEQTTSSATVEDKSISDTSLIHPHTAEIKQFNSIAVSYTIEPTVENLWKNAEIVALVRARSNEGAQYCFWEAYQPFTFIKVEVLENFKGELKTGDSLGIEGGTVTVKHFRETHAHLPPIYGDEKFLNLSEEEQLKSTYDDYKETFVDIKKDGVYLLFLNRDNSNQLHDPNANRQLPADENQNEYIDYPIDYIRQLMGGLSTFVYDQTNDSASNPKTNIKVSLSQLRGFKEKELVLPAYSENSLIRSLANPKNKQLKFVETAISEYDPIKAAQNTGEELGTVVLAKAVERVETRYNSIHATLPSTYLNLELIEAINGEFDTSKAVGFTGATITMQAFMDHLSPAQNDKFGYSALDVETREKTLVEIYRRDFVDIVEGKIYLLFLNTRDDGSLMQRYGGYSVFEYDEKNDTVYNSLLDIRYSMDVVRSLTGKTN